MYAGDGLEAADEYNMIKRREENDNVPIPL
jgi:hypothetical protein